MDWKTNEAGFTLVEMLLILFIITMTLPFTVYLLQSIQTTLHHENISVQQFFIYLRNDALVAKNVYDDNDRLYFHINKHETAVIERNKHVIRRRLDGGNEIYLRDVASLKIESVPFGFQVTVITLKGDVYEKTIATFDEQ